MQNSASLLVLSRFALSIQISSIIISRQSVITHDNVKVLSIYFLCPTTPPSTSSCPTAGAHKARANDAAAGRYRV
ncbi:hypothetical protein C8J57DRAFT_1318271 [Mycena rebaudengoi]|nr:hypothetical protein C8J57DRAFT_1318271 [Mycena rebaudengoi]